MLLNAGSPFGPVLRDEPGRPAEAKHGREGQRMGQLEGRPGPPRPTTTPSMQLFRGIHRQASRPPRSAGRYDQKLVSRFVLVFLFFQKDIGFTVFDFCFFFSPCTSGC